MQEFKLCSAFQPSLHKVGLCVSFQVERNLGTSLSGKNRLEGV